METVGLFEAKTHLSRLVSRAANGEPFIIAKAGKPLVKVVPLDTPSKGKTSRVGFLDGLIDVPDDFKSIGAEEIEEMFYGKR